jgi:ribosomal protein S18 acetylase RimI-like enzyme
MLIEPVHSNERQSLIDLAVMTGLFGTEDAEGLLGSVLDALAAGSLPDGHAAIVCRAMAGAPPLGWSYFAPDQYADRVWNLWWIGVLPEHQGTSAAHALLSHVESTAAQSGARILIIETRDLGPMARARRFYVKRGYTERGRIPDFYAENESKVIFSRSIPGAT